VERVVSDALPFGDFDRYAAESRRRIPPMFRAAEVTDPVVRAWRDRLTGWIAAPWRDRGAAPPSLLITGPTGVGKTHQAYGVIRAVIEGCPGYGWEAVRTSDLFAEMRPRDVARGQDGPWSAYGRYAEAGLLMVDDIGATKGTMFTDEILDRLIDHRWTQELPSIFTTNLLVSGEPSLESELSVRVVSRLRGCTLAALKGEDRRKPPGR
jgi:DNA replication protein DnaC